MQVVTSLSTAMAVANPAIRQIVTQRIQELGGESFDADAIGYLLVLQAGDTLEAIQAQIGFDILCNRFNGVRFDQPDFHPSFEFIEEMPCCFDMVFILSDSGYGIEIFVPKEDAMPPGLIAMCQRFAFTADPEDMP